MHHLALGQEAIGAGIIGAIRDTDWLTPTHRMHAAQLYRCDLKLFAAEQFGKVTGSNMGMACDYHMSVPERRLLFGNGILGQNIPISAGFAHSLKLSGKDEIVVACEGDGAFAEGINYEVMYMAATYGLPLVLLVEDNKYAISYSSDVNKTSYADRARAFGISAVTVDGNDAVAVCEAVEAAAEKARKNETCMVECKTVRWAGHHTGDSQWWRDQEELDEAKKDDPIVRLEKQLYDLHYLTGSEREQIWKDISVDVTEAKQFALDGAFPDESVLLDYGKVYANPWEVAK
jgi:pyruvate dehydrogenase E1 component alpha subunit